MIIFLKRYGYNSNSSRNSKRIDFIRIPRFIAVGASNIDMCTLCQYVCVVNDCFLLGNFCSESTAPPYEYDGPWPRYSMYESLVAMNLAKLYHQCSDYIVLLFIYN